MQVNTARHASLGPGWVSFRYCGRVAGRCGSGISPRAATGTSGACWCIGARAHLNWSRRKKQIRSAWLTGLLARRPTNVVLLAMANKTARIAWAMLSRMARDTRRGSPLPLEPAAAANGIARVMMT